MIETVCPLCGLPRPRDAKQCVCNYTFEYGKLPATAPRARPGGAGAGKPGADRVLLGLVALVARDVRAALLVAPADVDSPAHTPPETRAFAPMPSARLPFPATVVASADDPFVSLDRARAFAAAWGAVFVAAGARGHLNAASGLGDWPAGRRALDELLARAGS